MLENIGINKDIIEWLDDKQLSYGLIYIPSLVKLKILKIYIKTHSKTGFIQPFKSHTGSFIYFNKKPNDNLQFCVKYQGLNNLTIKN